MLADPQAWASLRVTFTFAALWLPVTLIVPFLVALMLNSPKLRGVEPVPRPDLPALRRAVRGRRAHLAEHAAAGTGWLTRPARARLANPPDWLQRSDLDLPGPGAHRHLGHRRRRDHQSGGPPGRPDRAVRRGQDRRRRLVGTDAPRDPADDVAGDLLFADARHGRGDAVLPRAVRAQERHRASRAARPCSSTCTSTRASSPSSACPTARRSPGCCS